MKLIDLFEGRAQEQVHHNPSVVTLKALARNNKYHSARFVITKHGDVIAADSEHFTHHSMYPHMPTWEVRGYVQYMGDGEYAYRSMEVYSALNKDHPIFRIWERGGIQNGNPDQSDLQEGMNPFIHKNRCISEHVHMAHLGSGAQVFMIHEDQQLASYLLVQEFEGNPWILEAATMPAYRRQGYNSLLIDNAIKLYGEVFVDMDSTPDSIKAIESYVSRTPYRVRRLDTQTGEFYDYNPHDPTDQITPMYDVHVPGVQRPAHVQGSKWVWHLSLDKPRHPLLMGYIKQTDVMQTPTHEIRSQIREAWSNKYKKSIKCNNYNLFDFSIALPDTPYTLNESIKDQLKSWVKLDQTIRGEYLKFVQDKFGGDYATARSEWMKIKHTTEQDFFGTQQQEHQIHKRLLNQLSYMPLATFSQEDWHNLWLLTQHADELPVLQKRVLDKLKQYPQIPGQDKRIRYLTDRLLSGQGKTQRYNTQDDQWQTKLSSHKQRRWGHT